MADSDRTATNSVKERLKEKPYAFDFYHAVRSLECLMSEQQGKALVGQSQLPKQDVIHFGQQVSLGFSPSSIRSFQSGQPALPETMFVSFLGLLGPNGPLPLHVSEFIYNRIHSHGDTTLARFLDIFNNRMIAFFYRAWAVNNPVTSLTESMDDRYTFYNRSLLGRAEQSLRNRDALPDSVKMYYAGRFANSTKNAEGLLEILKSYFDTSAELEEFVGHWVPLEQEHRCLFGGDPGNLKLGKSVIVGSSFFDCQQKIRLKIGPLKMRQYVEFLPGGRAYSQLRDIINNYVGFEFLWEAVVVLRAAEVPDCSLNGRIRLGMTSWLKSSDMAGDPHDLVLRG